MTSKDRSDEMKKAVSLWKKITGVNPDARRQRFGDWDLVRTFEALEEAITLDPSEITANFLLTYFLNEHMEETQVPLRKVLDGDQELAARIEACRELYVLLGRPDVAEIRETFVAAIASAVSHYGAAARKDVKKLLASPDRVGLLRRDALRSIANLKIDQFLSGDPSPAGTSPRYAEIVHQWFNVNSLLAAAARMPPGIALNLIRTPNKFQCFFCFSIRNGGNLYLLSDVPEYAHPLQAQMTRRPDKGLDERASRNWFPYDLLGIAYDKEEGRLYFKEAEGQAVVPYQRHAVPLKKVAELSAEELVWTIMMFDLIKERFWRAGYQAKELSYTAEMLKAESTLTDVAKVENLPIALYEPVRLAPLSIDEVRADAVSTEAVGTLGHQTNRWMEDRYAGRIDAATLNLIAPPEVEFFLTKDGEVSRKVVRTERDDPFANRKGIRLEKFDGGSFGTRQSLANDQLFIARHSLAVQVGKLANEEFAEREAEISKWYREGIVKNADNLVAWASNPEIWVCDGKGGTFENWHPHIGSARKLGEADRVRGINEELMFRNLVRHHEIKRESGYAAAGFRLPDAGEFDQKCFFYGTKPSHYFVLMPGNAAELALFAGCHPDELPDVLQHFSLRNRYSGNSILDRIDPMEWKIKNPWIGKDFRIRIALSKRGVAEAMRRRKLPPIDGVATSPPDGSFGISTIRF